MTSLLVTLLVIAIALFVIALNIIISKNELLQGYKRTISDKRADCESYLDRWRNRLEQITEYSIENERLREQKKFDADRIQYLAPFEYKAGSLEQANRELNRKLVSAESDSRTSRDAVNRGFNEFQELLSATRAIVPDKVITKGVEEGLSIKQIVLLHLQQIAERKAARRG